MVRLVAYNTPIAKYIPRSRRTCKWVVTPGYQQLTNLVEDPSNSLPELMSELFIYH